MLKAIFIGTIPSLYWGWNIYEQKERVGTVRQCKLEAATHGRYTNKEVIDMYMVNKTNG